MLAVLARASLSRRKMRSALLSFAASCVMALSVGLGLGCASATGGGQQKVGVDEGEDGLAAESITAPVAVGATLKTTATVNLRSGPSTSKTIVDVVDKGATVTALDAAPSAGFYHVKFGSESGWMYGAYLTVVSGGGGGGTVTTWSCTGSYGTKQPADGNYDLTAFGCWVDAGGVAHGDSGDNCLPGCFAQAKSAGLCSSSGTGKACEEKVTWYVADAGRFGCLQRVKITNPSNGRAVVAVVLDYGPACWVEAKVSKAALDASGRVNRYLFGADQGVTDRANVHVEPVSSDTALGPVH